MTECRRMLPIMEKPIDVSMEYYGSIPCLRSWFPLMTREEYRGFLLLKELEAIIDKDNPILTESNPYDTM